MTSIDKSSSQYNQSKGLVRSTLTEQSWLRFMEQSGLGPALREVQLMIADKTPLSSHLSKLDQLQDRNSKKNEIAPSNEATTSTSGQGWYGVSHSLSLPGTNEKVLMTAEEANQDAKVVYAEVMDSPGSVKGTKWLDPLKTLDGFKAVRDYQEWGLQNTSVLRSGSGVELWIRDANFSDNKLQELLKVVRDSMGSLGASLVKIVINGKPVFSEAKPEQQAIKEQ